MEVSPDGSTLYIGAPGGGVSLDLATGNAQLLLSPLSTAYSQGFTSCPLVLNASATTAYGSVEQPSSSDYGVDALDLSTGSASTVTPTSLLDVTTFAGQLQGAPFSAALSPDGSHLFVAGAVGISSSDISSDTVGFQSVDLGSGSISAPVTAFGAGWQTAGLVAAPDGETAYAAAYDNNGGQIESEVVPITMSDGSVGAPIASVGGFDPATSQFGALMGVVLPATSSGSSSCTAAPNLGNAAGFTWAPTPGVSGNGVGVEYGFTACTDSSTDDYFWTTPSQSGSLEGTGLTTAGWPLPVGPQSVTLTVKDGSGAVLGTLTQTVDVVPDPILTEVSTGIASPLSQLDVRSIVSDCDSLVGGGATSYVLTVDGQAGSTNSTCSPTIDIDTPTGSHTVTLSVTDSLGDVETTSLVLNVLPVAVISVDETPMEQGASYDAVIIDACASYGATNYYLSAPPSPTVSGGQGQSYCSEEVLASSRPDLRLHGPGHRRQRSVELVHLNRHEVLAPRSAPAAGHLRLYLEPV